MKELGPEKLSDLPKATQLIMEELGGAELQAQTPKLTLQRHTALLPETAVKVSFPYNSEINLPFLRDTSRN